MFSSNKYIYMNQQNSQNEYQETTSSIIDLESLSAQYRNLLIEYQFAVANYVNYLREEAATPCGQYNGNSTSIDQRCYNEIWKKGGCTTTAGQLNTWPNWQNWSLNSLIQDTFKYASSKDNDPRFTSYNKSMTCYGNGRNPYIILCTGTDGRLYSRPGLDGPWSLVVDNTSACTGICTMSDGQGLLGIGGNNIFTKTSYTANWTGPIQYPCCVMSVAMAQDGTIVGVGMDNALWSKPSLNENWTRTASPGEWITSVAIAPDGSIFVIGGGNQIWKKNSYQNLPSQQWQGMGCCCVKSITIAPDGTFIGVGMDNQLYAKPNYQTIATDPWGGPFSAENSSCCAISITTVANPNYNASDYNQATEPNYNNINQPQMTAVQGSVYWGTNGISINNSATLQDCEASCASTNGCTGATYNPTAHGQPMCWLRSGDSDMAAGLDTDYAIIPKGKQLLSVVQNINNQLTNINQQIQQKTDSEQPLYDSQTQQRKLKTSELISQFIQLNLERDRINEMLNDYQTLDQDQTEGNLMINQNYYSFLLLLALAIVVIFLLYKFGMPSKASPGNLASPPLQSGGQLGISTYYIILGIVLVILLVNFMKK
jgi:hypothetical protein